MTDELKDGNGEPAFEGKTLDADIWVTADHTHAYPQYYIGEKSGYFSYEGNTHLGGYTGKNSSDLGGETEFSRNYTPAVEGKSDQIYEARMVNRLTYKDTGAIKVEYRFNDEEYAYDEQGATLLVSGIKNDTQHYLDHMETTVSFVDEDGFRGFTLTEIPQLSYPEKLPEDAGRQEIKLEYWCKGVSEWVESTGKEDEAFLRTVEKVRWTYYNVTAKDTGGEELSFDPVTLVGVGRYEDIRPKSSNTQMAETYQALLTGTVDHYHYNREEKTVGDQAAAVILDKEIRLNESAEYTRAVYRENPEVEFYTQVFDEEDQAAADYDQDAVQKTGYRPGETMWQKIVLINRHIVQNGKQSGDQGVLLNPVIYDKLPEYLSSVGKI